MPPKKKKRDFSKNSDEPRQKIDLTTSVAYHGHEEEQLCSSAYSNGAVVLGPRELKQKLLIATNILIECRDEKKNLLSGTCGDGTNDSVLQILNNFTNLPLDELKNINKSVRTRDRSFEKALKDVKVIPSPTLEFIADEIRKIIIKFILEENCFPSKLDLLKNLKGKVCKYTLEHLPIQRLAQNKLIKYRHFPELNRYLLTEHPENVYKRTMYLKNITELRSQDRNFVYVEVKRMIPKNAAVGFIAGLAAFPSKGKLEKFFTKDSGDLIAKKWLQQRILPHIDEGNVVVFTQPKSRNKVTIQGRRYDIISWLDEHGIPYGKNPHTAELYELYKAFKGKVRQTGIYDHVFLNAGHTLVHCPLEWQKLNFFQAIWSNIEVMDGYHSGRPETLKQTILNSAELLSTLNIVEEKLIEEEFKMLLEDSKMEEIVENVFEIVKNGEVQVLEFPKECCGDKTDYFEINVGDYVLDLTGA